MAYQESQPTRKKGSDGGRKVNLRDIDNVLRRRAAGLKHKAISELTGIPISTLEGYIRDFTWDENGKIVRKIKK